VVPISRLANRALLSHFAPEELALLASALTERAISPGQVVLRFGEPARREAFLLDSGAVRIQRATPYGIFPLAELREGEMFGEASFVDPAERSGDAVVLEAGRVYIWSEERLRPLLAENVRLNSAVQWTFWKALAAKLRQTNERLLEFFTHGTPPPRVEPLSPKPGTGTFRIDLATKRALFAEQKLSSLEINFLSSLSKERKLPPGAVLFREGDPGDSMYVVLEGRVRISKLIPGAGEEALAILERGDYFGEMALIDGAPRSAMAKAHDGGAVVLEISRDVVEGLLDPNKVSSPRLLEIFCRLIAKRLREIDEKLVGWFILSAGNWPGANPKG
jgi:CRP-like cAMP-binding protein